MKRTATIATVFVAAVLIGGGSYSALATGGSDRHGSGPEDRPAVTASASPPSVTAAQAAAAAQKLYPGTVAKVDLDDDHPGYWEVYVVGADHVRRELHVDTRTGAVTMDRRGGDDRPGDDHRGAAGVGDDRPGDDHGVHAGGDDHVGDDNGRGRGRDRDGHGGDDR